MRYISSLCAILLFCNIYAGQANDSLSPLYALCVHELAISGVDNRNMPDKIQDDIHQWQVRLDSERLGRYRVYRSYALENQVYELGEGFPQPVQEGIAYADQYFARAPISYTTECARGYMSIPTVVRGMFMLQAIGCAASLGCIGLFPPLLTKVVIAGASCSAAGGLLETSFRCCFRKACLEAAFPDPESIPKEFYQFTSPYSVQSQITHMDLRVPGHAEVQQEGVRVDLDAPLPHGNPPQSVRMILNVPDDSHAQREQFPVDEDTSGEDVVYNDGARLLEDV